MYSAELMYDDVGVNAESLLPSVRSDRIVFCANWRIILLDLEGLCGLLYYHSVTLLCSESADNMYFVVLGD